MRYPQDSAPDGQGLSPGQRVRKWVFLDANRGLVAGFVAAVYFVLALGLTTSRFVPLRAETPMFYLFSALIGGNITLVTVVVAINQLVLSRELNRPGELQLQIERASDYRKSVEDTAGRIPPVDPHGFLQLLVENVRERARHLRSLARTHDDESVVEDVDEVTSGIISHFDRIESLLDGSDVSTFNVLSTIILSDYAGTIYRLEQIEFRHAESLNSGDSGAIDALVECFEELDIARQYFKTIYLQEELARLSRRLFYVGIPAVTVLVGGLLLLTGSEGVAISRPALAVLLPAVTMIGLLSLFVLFSFFLRIATIAQRTAATTPFTTPVQKG